MSTEYTYPGTNVLINKADIRDPDVLHDFERGRTALRHLELEIIPIKGSFDLDHLRAIHRHLFQDVYSFAGNLRTVNISKNGFPFCDYNQFERHAGYVFGQLKQDNFLKGLSPDAFAKKAAYYYQEINFGHYFREGNGRSIRTYFEQLSKQAGYDLDWSQVPKQEYMVAVKATDDPTQLSPLVNVFKRMIAPQGEREALMMEKAVSAMENSAAANDKWIQPMKETTLKDLLKKMDGLPAVDNKIPLDASILNIPVKKYQLTNGVNGMQTVKVQLKGHDSTLGIRLEKIPHLSKQAKNQMIENAAGAKAQPMKQIDKYMEM